MDEIQQLEKQAVEAAINNDWKISIEINKKIINLDKNNLDAYLRLGFAYFQSGKLNEAKKTYLKILKIQPNNPTAKKNYEKIKILLEKKLTKEINNTNLSLDPNIFMDVPGKTKIVQLVNCGQKVVLAKLNIGEEVFLVPKKRRIEIRNKNKEYIGCLPDDLSKRLSIFIKAGSQFQVLIKESNLKNATVFIKEIKRGNKVKRYITFPININSNLQNIQDQSDDQSNEDEEISLDELEKLAESLTEEKEQDYYGIEQETNEEDEE